MSLRIIVALIALPLYFIILYLLPPIFFPIAISIICGVSVFELLWTTSIIKDKTVLIIASLYSMVLPIVIYYKIIEYHLGVGIFLLVLVLFLLWMRDLQMFSFDKLCITVFVATVMPFFFSLLISIINMPNGKLLITIPFAAAWITDTGAYFSGVLFGQHKLAPKISPHKTIEGSIGGIIFSAIAFVIIGFIGDKCFHIIPNYLLLIIYGIILSILAQLGDLCLSMIKRQYEIKDYGSIFPGHGGILDRFDSVLFTAPSAFMLLHYLPSVFSGLM